MTPNSNLYTKTNHCKGKNKDPELGNWMSIVTQPLLSYMSLGHHFTFLCLGVFNSNKEVQLLSWNS